MKRLGKKVCLVAVLSLAVVAIWHDYAAAVTSPVVKSLGQITEGVISPTRIDVDSAGTLYVSDSRLNGIARYDKYGKALPILEGNYRVKGTGVAVAPDGSRVYVSVADPDGLATASPTAVAVVDGQTGALLGYLGDNGLNEFKSALEIALDASGNLYVADGTAKSIGVYNGATYKKLFSFGRGPAVAGALPQPGEFGSISGLAINLQSNEIYVTEGWGNNGIARVQVFGLDGTFKRLLTEAKFAGPSPAGVLPAYSAEINCKPNSIAFDNAGRAYLLSMQYGSVHFFSTAVPEVYLGKYAKVPVVGAAYGVGMIVTPAFDLSFDPGTGRLFVSMDGNGIQIFGIDGGTTPVKKNTAPGVPEQLSPVKGSEVATLTPELQWKAAADAEGDALTYNLQIVDADGQPVASSSGIAGTSALAEANKLVENKAYGWQVQSSDAELTSDYSAIETFWVNAVQEAPTAVVLETPAADVYAMRDTIFSWQAASDADPFDTVSYRLEIAATSDFAEPVISVDLGETASAPFASLPGYAALQPGAAYFWRVLAIDNEGLSTASTPRSFVYNSTTLTIDANFPGAKVYLGGNHAYSGRYVGEVPVELRDLIPGVLDVVVERAGFEPWVGIVTLKQGGSSAVKAQLSGAIIPAGLKARPLSAGGEKIQWGKAIVPFAVDYNSDGLIDLLAADDSGKIVLYPGVAGVEQPAFAAPVALDLILPVSAAPVVADWDNDGRKDLLVGSADGAVLLYRNVGTQAQPLFASPVALAADNAPLSVGHNAVPAIFDENSDGKKDLLIGSGDGAIYRFLNSGSDDAPLFAAREILIPAGGAVNAAPCVADWNADGVKELLVASSQGIALYNRQADGSFALGEALALGEDLVDKKGKATVGNAVLGEMVRLFAYDADGKKGKDLIVGNAAGQIRLAASFGKSVSPQYTVALDEKVDQVATLLVAKGLQSAQIVVRLEQIRYHIDKGNYDAARAQIASLQTVVQAENDVVEALADLACQLLTKSE